MFRFRSLLDRSSDQRGFVDDGFCWLVVLVELLSVALAPARPPETVLGPLLSVLVASEFLWCLWCLWCFLPVVFAVVSVV